MPKRILDSETIGKRFGKLTVISRGTKRQSGQYWLCRCDCGNEKEVRSDHLRAGNIKRCGHCTKIIIGTKVSIYKTNNDKQFIFDTADYDLVSAYSWSINKNGYPMAYSKDGTILLHRMLLGFPDCFIDHINGDKTDNRRENLRICSYAENSYNQKLRSDNSSGIKGVCFDRSRNKYKSKIVHHGKQIHLGYFTNPIEAAKAYDKAAAFYFGEFARPNFPRKEEETNGRDKEQALLEMEKPLVYQRSWRTNPGANALS